MNQFNPAYLSQTCLSWAANGHKLSSFMQNTPPKIRNVPIFSRKHSTIPELYLNILL